jgi:hypothetical protein
MKAIETTYKGYRFRSRLEARWAVFFDALGYNYKYENEGFLVGIGQDRPYLPDFYLPDTKTYVEVKGSYEKLDWGLIEQATDYGLGLPEIYNSFDYKDECRSLLLLGDIPLIREGSYAIPAHLTVAHNEGSIATYAIFTLDGPRMLTKYGGVGLPPSVNSHFQRVFNGEVFSLSYGSLGILGGAYITESTTETYAHKDIAAAYEKARQARFEHGENGR